MASKNITAFSFASPAATGTIRGTNISIIVPIATDVTALVATFTHTGSSVAVGSTAQTSGVTANDFTSAVTYTVTASDATTQDYTVTVTVSGVTATQLAQFRRMIAESTTATYDDQTLRELIMNYPCVDENGESPRVPAAEVSASILYNDEDVQVDNPDWTATYDLHRAAAAVWEEKAGSVAHRFDFNADGGNYSRSQAYEQYMQQARYHLARRNPSTIIMVPNIARDPSGEIDA
jgi:hypothetical protein